MALKCAECVALGIKDVDLGVVESNDDVLGGQVQAGYDTAILGDGPGDIPTTGAPSGIDEVSLFEMRLVRLEGGSRG